MLAIIGAFAVVTLILTAFGSSGSQPESSTPSGAVTLPADRPQLEWVSTVSNVRIQLPVAQGSVTAIGFHASTNGALALKPLGRQINEGLLTRLWHKISGSSKNARPWYQLPGGSGPGTAVLDIGAPPGTDVYAPADGTIASISATMLNGSQHGSRIDIRPAATPSVILSISHVQPDPALAVGSAVQARTSHLGTVADIGLIERQALARHTNDNGDNVAIEVHTAPASLP